MLSLAIRSSQGSGPVLLRNLRRSVVIRRSHRVDTIIISILSVWQEGLLVQLPELFG
jgi:hypothetical protein